MVKKAHAVKWGVAAFLALVIFSALRLPYLDMPLDRDEGTYLVIGKQVAEGKLPYKDVYEMKPPGLFYTYALMASVGAYGFDGARLYTICFYGLAGILLFLILYRKGWQWGALASQLVFYTLSMNPYIHGFALLPEAIMVFFFLLGILLLDFTNRHWALAVLGGFLLGWSFWIKQNMLFPLSFLALWAGYALWIRRETSFRRVGLVLLGFISGPFLTTLWIVIHGGWSDMLYWMLTYPATVYTQSISWSKGLEYLISFLNYSAPHSMIWVALACLGFIAHFFLKKGVWGRATPALFAVFSLLAVSPGLRFYGHYWILVLPALALGVGALWEFMGVQIGRNLSSKYKDLLLAALLLCVFAFHFSNQRNVYIKPSVESWARRSYGNNPFLEIQDIASKLKTYGNVKEEVAVMGSEPQLYVYLKQTPFTAHTFITFLNKRHPRRGKMRSEFTSDVQGEKPLYLVFVNHPYSWSITEGDHQDVYQWAYRYAKNQYRPIALYEMDGLASDRRIWAQDANSLQPKANKYIQVLIRK